MPNNNGSKEQNYHAIRSVAVQKHSSPRSTCAPPLTAGTPLPETSHASPELPSGGGSGPLSLPPDSGASDTTPSLQHSTPPPSSTAAWLRQFTDLDVLRKATDTRRTTALLRRFATELAAAGLSIPAASQDLIDNDYFNRWLELLSHSQCPPVLLETLLALETATLPENHHTIDDAILRRISNISLTPHRLDQALELWFHAPEELAPFHLNKPTLSGTLSPSASPDVAQVSQPAVSQASSLQSAESAENLCSGTCLSAPSQLSVEAESTPPSSIQAPVTSIDSSRPSLASPTSVENSSSICVNPPVLRSVPAKDGCSSMVENSGTDQSSPLSTYQRINLSTPPGSFGALLLNDLSSLIRRFVVLPPHAADTLALWVLHTYAFKLRDISTYIGIESPDKGCGKTTLLRVLGKLVHKPVSTANVSPSALFRVIEDLQPTLLIDEGDTFLRNNDELRGILNAGYTPDTAFILRASNESTSSQSDTLSSTLSLASFENRHSKIENLNTGFRQFSTWCPKAIAMIGRLPDTLGDRCIIIRMQKKSRDQKCERLRDLDVANLPARCEAFVNEHAGLIAKSRPAIPPQLGDRAADIWEPLLVLADVAGAAWSEQARTAAIRTSIKAQQESPIASLLADLTLIFAKLPGPKRLFTRDLVHFLNCLSDRPWSVLAKGKPITDLWLSATLRPYGIASKTMWINGKAAKGYDYEDCAEVFKRYLPPH